ncbi:hypothetical protein FACS1894111_03590 [Clostridia bacterium]|nr:hypothetical protein FACS1894111_03590 [Clostridia bacterium]
MKQTIFYGAGKNAEDNFSAWTDLGMIPVCFADADKTKHYSKFQSSEIDILPLEEAILKYPDFELYVTPTSEKWESIAAYLAKWGGVPLAAIKFFEPVEYRKGCPSMGRCFITYNKIGCCCVPVYRDNFEFEINSDYRLNFRYFEEKSKAVIDDWRNNRPSICDGCPNLIFGIYDIAPVVEELNISSKDNADFCNTKCIYCSSFPKPEQATYEERGREVIAMLETAHSLYPDHKFRVYVSGGDIAVAPFRDKLFDVLKKYAWNADIYSNSAVYCEAAAEQLRDGQSAYVTTLDSTIREKFAEIKGVDCLPKVLENIKRYSEAAVDKRQINIKLIVLDGIYENFEEMGGVVDFVESIGANLWLSCNVYNADKRLSDGMFEMTVRLLNYAFNKQIFVNIMYDHFNIEDAAMLRNQWEIIQGGIT